MFQYPLFACRTTTVRKSVLCTCMVTIFLAYLEEVFSELGRPPMVAPGHYDNFPNQYSQHPRSPGDVPLGQPAENFEEQSKPVQYAPGHQQPPPPSHMAQHTTGQEQKLLHAPIMQHEKEHIAEHMDVPIDTSKMSEQELQFHYFKMHDNDNNNMLDGTELIKSLIHWHESGQDAPRGQHAHQQSPSPKLFTDEELIQLIDPILKMDDTNLDGYIDYPEFIRAQQKTATVH